MRIHDTRQLHPFSTLTSSPFIPNVERMPNRWDMVIFWWVMFRDQVK